MSARKKGAIVGSLIAIGLFIFTEVLFYTQSVETLRSLDFILLALFAAITIPLMIMYHEQAEREETTARNNQLEGEYEITYTLKCTYHKIAFNSEDALEHLTPFDSLEEDEVEVISYKATYVGDSNERR